MSEIEVILGSTPAGSPVGGVFTKLTVLSRRGGVRLAAVSISAKHHCMPPQGFELEKLEQLEMEA